MKKFNARFGEFLGAQPCPAELEVSVDNTKPGIAHAPFTDFQQSWTDVSQDAAQHQDMGLPGPPSGPHRSQAGKAQRPEVVCRPQLQR